MTFHLKYEHVAFPLGAIVLILLLSLAYYQRSNQDELIEALLVTDVTDSTISTEQAKNLSQLTQNEIIDLLQHLFNRRNANYHLSNQAILLAALYGDQDINSKVTRMYNQEQYQKILDKRCKKICPYGFFDAVTSTEEPSACNKSSEYIELLFPTHSFDKVLGVVQQLNQDFLLYLLKNPDSLIDLLSLNEIMDDDILRKGQTLIIYELGLRPYQLETFQYLVQWLLFNYTVEKKQLAHFLERALVCQSLAKKQSSR